MLFKQARNFTNQGLTITAKVLIPNVCQLFARLENNFKNENELSVFIILFQYIRWCRKEESNLRPTDYEIDVDTLNLNELGQKILSVT